MGPSLRGPLGYVSAIAFSPDGKLIAATGTRQAVIWDAAQRKIIWKLPVEGHDARAVSFSADGRTVAIGLSEFVVLYDLRTSRQIHKPLGDGPIDDLDSTQTKAARDGDPRGERVHLARRR